MTDQPDPGTPAPPATPAASSGPEAPPPAAPAEPTPPPAGGDTPVKLNRWLVRGMAAVVLVAVVVVAVLVLGGNDDGGGDDEDNGGPVEIDATLPAQVDARDASSPVVALATNTQWDLDGGRFNTTSGNFCSHRGPGTLPICVLIGGDPNNRREIPGADVTTRDGLGPTPAGRALDGDVVEGCPGAADLPEPGSPIAAGPALCVLSSENRVFAIYLTGVEDSGFVHLVAVEVGT
jgi:hypothetical protein